MSDQQLDPQALQQEENTLIALRKEKLAAGRAKGQAFPNDFRRDSYCNDLQKQYVDKTKEELAEAAIPVKVAGRIMLNRGSFMVIQDMTGRIQVYVNRKTLPEETLAEVKTWDLGDIIAAEGTLARSGKGDLYVEMTSVRLLTKSLRPLPDKHHGLTDTEQRYRQRYVDLIVNEDVRETFRVRSRVIAHIRSFLMQRDFLEVETPMLQTIPGGAAAKPFETHHNALDLEMFLRIAPELYLKRLVVGGFEKVFEINRNFRNEGVSTRHNPEFTMLEFYQAYADYEDNMDLTEELFRELAQLVLGSTDVPYGDKVFHFGEPFVRLSVFDSILKYNPELTAADLQDVDKARAIAKKAGAKVLGFEGLGKLQVMIFEDWSSTSLSSRISSPSTRSKCRRWPVATMTIRTSPTVSSCSSAAARSPMPTPSSMTQKIRPNAFRHRWPTRMPVTTRPCTTTPTLFVRWNTACRPRRARGSVSTGW